MIKFNKHWPKLLGLKRTSGFTFFRTATTIVVSVFLSACLEDNHVHVTEHEHEQLETDESSVEFGDEYWASLAENFPAYMGPPGAAVAVEDRIRIGDWGPLTDWPIIATGAANMPNGEIMAWASWKADSFIAEAGEPADVERENTHGVFYDPFNNAFGDRSHSTHDMFCAGVSMLDDGRVFIAGGGNTVSSTSIFGDGDFSEIESLTQTRWYPSSTTMASGQVVTALGNIRSPYPEIWTDGQGWDILGNVSLQSLLDEDDYFYRDWYPSLNVAPDGSLFHPGQMPELLSVHVHDDNIDTSVHSHGDRDDDPRLYNTTVMYDVGKMLVAGGGYGQNKLENGQFVLDFSLVTDTAVTMDLNGDEPVTTPTGSLNLKRSMQNSVVLPDGKVLVIGGTADGVQFSDQGSVHNPEMWDPETGEWSIMAQHTTPRNYHSIAILLKDGTVLSAGGGLCGACNTNHQNGQIYSPPYLFDAAGDRIARPSITGGDAEAFAGDSVTVTGSDDLTKFNMVRLVAITHHHTTDQRLIPTNFTKTAVGEYQLDLHENANVLIPGYYWVFGLDANGTPTEGHTIQIKVSPENEPPAAEVVIPKVAYEYYEQEWIEPFTLPNFDALTPVKTGYLEEFELSQKQRNDNYAFRFKSKLIVPVAGQYTFYLASDDGSKLFINGQQVVNADGAHGFEAVEQTGNIQLPAGQHDIELQYFEVKGGDALQVAWQGPQFSKRLLESQHLTEDVGAAAPVVAGTPGYVHYAYYEGDWAQLPNFDALTPVKTGATDGFNLSVRDQDDFFAVVYDAVITVEQGGLYTFYTSSDDGSALLVNGSMLVNNDGLHPTKTEQGTIMLPAGEHALTVEYFERTLGSTLLVEWEGPGIAKQEIALSSLAISESLESTLPQALAAQPVVNPPVATGGGDAATPVNGLVNYDYYHGVYTTLPNFGALTPVKSGETAGFLLNERTQNDFFAFNFTGKITVPNNGVYTFYTVSDDGSRLRINGVDVVSNDGPHAPRERQGTITLSEGQHDIEVAFFERAGGELLEVLWSGPNIAKQNIPLSVLSSDSAVTTDAGVDGGTDTGADTDTGTDTGAGTDTGTNGGTDPATTVVASGINYSYYEGAWVAVPNYAALVPVTSGQTQTFNLDARHANDDYGFQFTTYLTITTAGQYTFFTASDDGSNLYVDNDKVVNNDGLHANQEKFGIRTLAPGEYKITVNFFERTGLDTLSVNWSGPGFLKQPLHNADLKVASAATATVDNGTVTDSDVDTDAPVDNTSATAADALKAEYYEGTWSAVPNFNALTPVATTDADDFTLPPSAGQLFYGYRFTGTLTIDQNDTYQFFVTSNDGSQLFINDQLVVDNNGLHAAIEKQGSMFLGAGEHTIELRYFQSGGSEALNVEWQSSTFARQPVSGAVLSAP